ncbi:hypothetical protein TrVGV298_010282 [Trichoderma virens]|nr:hypothetical protein TrVGV298_010282 [Trichoderma virens]
MVLESPGGQPHESDRLGGQEAPSGTTEPEARRAPEALALEVPSFQDLIVTFPEDILHEGALVASEIDTGASDLETAKAPVDAREVDPQSEDLRCLVAARLEETRQTVTLPIFPRSPSREISPTWQNNSYRSTGRTL